MSEKSGKFIKPEDNRANMQNANKGTSGTNRQYDQNQGNRGKQLNPNQKNKSFHLFSCLFAKFLVTSSQLVCSMTKDEHSGGKYVKTNRSNFSAFFGFLRRVC